MAQCHYKYVTQVGEIKLYKLYKNTAGRGVWLMGGCKIQTCYLNAAMYSASPIAGSNPPRQAMLTLYPRPDPQPH